MSEVISFRLNRENPREALALEVLKNRFRKGFSVRYVLTEALLKLDESEDASKNISYTAIPQPMTSTSVSMGMISPTKVRCA